MTEALGFHGKLPALGDFVRRRVSGDFLGVWDPWLERCVHGSRQSLGAGWLEAYLTSPIWRFAVSAGVCGSQACTGVIMPSVDSVGRYYPLTLVRPLPEGSSLLSLAVEDGQWFEQLEQLAMSVLEEGQGFDIDIFDQLVNAHGQRLQPRVADHQSHLLDPAHGPTRFQLDALTDVAAAMLAAQQVMLSGQQGFSIWWTEGSERIDPCLFMHPSLPAPEQFAAMIDGDWQRHGWDNRSVRWQAAAAAGTDPVVSAPLAVRSAGVCHVGKVRQVNEDALLDRPDIGLWAVADGVGGQQAGDVASRSVIDSLQGAEPGGDLQQRLNAARDMLAVANQHLVHAANRPDNPVNSASTVVALLSGGGSCCWLWAGDSRLYRLRDGSLERCSHDHSLVQDMVDRGEISEEQAASHPQSNVITRAVGAVAELQLDSRFSDLRPGDRFLLCSDGVHGFVSEAVIQAAMAAASPQLVTDTLLGAVLAGEARDNCTALAVFID